MMTLHSFSLAPTIGTIAVFVVVGLGFWFSMRIARAAIDAQTEIRRKLIDKCISAQELSALLESKGAQELLRGMGRRGGVGPRGALFGMLLIFLGLVLADTAYPHQVFIVILGVLMAAFGVLQIIMATIARKRYGNTGGNCPACGGPAQSCQ